MPKMRPVELPDDIRNEPFRRSEVLFFDCAKNLPSNWFVLYGVTWYLRIRNNSWSEGEADFVIVSPDTGLVVVEVKGGAIGRDDVGWYSIDRFGEKHRIKDPALQAAGCKHNLLRYIRERPEFRDRVIPARHMVCFPNVNSKDAPALIEVPREMQILSDDLENLEYTIKRFSARNYDDNGSSNIKLSPKECAAIADILKPTFECPNRWSTQAKKQNEIMKALTDDQAYLWEIMEGNDRISLSGPAGSGKTILALKLIKSVIDSGGSALALLPSAALQSFYSTTISSHRLTVASYDTSSSTKHLNGTPTIVVIDEAQDISEDGWLYLYEKYHIEKAQKFLCVFDSNQRLKKAGCICPLEHLVPLRLSKILRNTKQIGEFSARFFTDTKPCSIIGPDGIRVQYSVIHDEIEMLNEVVALISKYVEVEEFDYSDIVVLFADNAKSRFKQEGNKGNSIGVSFRSSRGYEGSYMHKSPCVLTDSVFAFRGLESKIVILVGLDNLQKDIRDNACYIGASRARNVLHIVALRSTIKSLQSD